MSALPTGTAVPIHLRADEYELVGPEDLGAEGVRAREIVGPFGSIAAFGPLVVVHDRRFDPRSGSIPQPHRGMEQLFYVLDGTLRHTDSFEGMEGTIGTGELGILTEGREGMGHVERNDEDVAVRVIVLAYPADPMPDEATFAIRADASMPRLSPHEGVRSKVLVEREVAGVHGQLREFADTQFEVGGVLRIELDPGEGAWLFCLDGRFQVVADAGSPTPSIGIDDSVLFPPAPEARQVVIDAQAPGRLVHAVTSTGFGLRLQDVDG